MFISSSPFCIFLLFASSLSLLPSTFCSHLHHSSHFLTHNITNIHHFPKVSSEKISDITIHGFLLWASMGLFMPLGILIIRISITQEPSSARTALLFYLHVAFQMISVLLTTIGAAMSLKKFENSFDNSHQRLGLALYAAVLLQVFLGVFRPHRGKKERSYWYIMHWIVGTTVSLVGIINIYTGLRAYHKRTLKSTTLWTILFTLQVSIFALLFLLQDKLDYLKKQTLILPTSIHHSPPIVSSINPHNHTHKELIPVSSAKSNALASLFD
ncbi:cytochrome b561 domain-containing protein At4g18260-like [Prosopis cineraria]|uniref:cytochrome b561 domain-containing protein At4g18260-like n=1 Tax=Prosopis cineraria TaxID=364024 RepID=UPI00240F799D|nr:cytochrome b561 domain-containing protein At4g18260-like [Prosopis cineraria]